jgi:hypothetical protein
MRAFQPRLVQLNGFADCSEAHADPGTFPIIPQRNSPWMRKPALQGAKGFGLPCSQKTCWTKIRKKTHYPVTSPLGFAAGTDSARISEQR